MPTIFDRLAPTAKRLIDELDVDVVVQERSVAESASAGTTTVTPTSRAALAALKEFVESFDPGTRKRVVEGTVIVPASYVPNGIEPGWSIFLDTVTTDATKEHKVVEVERVPKVGTAIVWKAKVRR